MQDILLFIVIIYLPAVSQRSPSFITTYSSKFTGQNAKK